MDLLHEEGQVKSWIELLPKVSFQIPFAFLLKKYGRE
jgi:hypothetical protein